MAETVARAAGASGELVLRVGDDDHLELVSNGVFLMDTRDGRSERSLISGAVDLATREVRRVAIGGLGMGFTLARALATPSIQDIVVIEREPAVVRWSVTHAAAVTGGDTSAPGVEVVLADLVSWLSDPRTAARPFDVICLDTDNGPDWLVDDGNAWLYGDDGLAALRDRLAPGGVLAVWSAADAPQLRDRLTRGFAAHRSVAIPVARGEPDHIEFARR